MKRVLGCLFSFAILGIIAAVPAFSQVDLGKNINWRVFNVMPATSSFWDINKAQSSGNGLQFPIQPFDSPTTGSFAVYLLANYNYDITDKTFSADVSWTSGTYVTRSTVNPGAYVRFWFQDVTSGPYTPNDYWWSTGANSIDLNAGASGHLTIELTDRTKWTNMCGRSATDTTAPWTDCMTGGTMTVSPYDGFTRAMKNVKQLGLSFGSSGTYASGVAIDGAPPGTFTVNTFTIQ